MRFISVRIGSAIRVLEMGMVAFRANAQTSVKASEKAQ
jgi:hypothetical protein